MSILSSSLSPSSLLSSSLMFLLLFFSFIASTPVNADDNTYTINNAPEFIDFAKKVNNNGAIFSGVTVFLNDDIDFSSCTDNFEPVGKYSYSNYFAGTFDGQGHTITNLVVNSSDLRYTGLFGHSEGLTIKNLIIDSSCSFTNYYNRSDYNDAFVSSVVGDCETSGSTTCTIESVVNMADVSYLHESRTYVIAGGIVAKCTVNCVLTNIVNFGSVLAASGVSSNFIYSGGIVGEIGRISSVGSIKNCINYGTVTNSIKGKEFTLVGGIAGVVWSNVAIENCLVAGPVSSDKSTGLYTGSIIGGTKPSSSTTPYNNTIINCFWAEGVGSLNASGQVIDNTSVLITTNTSTIEMNESTLAMIRDIMNTDTSSECGWVTVHLNGGRFGNSTQEDLILLQKSLITDPVKEGHSFVTWCTDPECTKSCNSSSVSECTSAELYAAWNVSTVTFLTLDNNNTVVMRNFSFNQQIVFPTGISKAGHSLVGWDNKTSVSHGIDTAISAIWTINNYTLTINFDNGTVVDVEVEFNSTINLPNVSEREGYTFLGWNDTIPTNMPAHNITISAIWAINNYTLAIDFDNGTVVDVEVEFNSTINITRPTREGYKFLGWNDTIPTNMPAHNIAVKAIWVNVTSPSYSIEIVFGTKDLSNDEINEIIQKYSSGGGGYEITNITHSNDGVSVIVKFNGSEEVMNFVENISESGEMNGVIVRISFINEDVGSFSTRSVPSFFLLIFSVLFILI